MGPFKRMRTAPNGDRGYFQKVPYETPEGSRKLRDEWVVVKTAAQIELEKMAKRAKRESGRGGAKEGEVRQFSFMGHSAERLELLRDKNDRGPRGSGGESE